MKKNIFNLLSGSAPAEENQVKSDIPSSYDLYDIKMPSPLLAKDEEIYKRFYELGFTNAQAQLVYDLANERVLPYLNSLSTEFEFERQREKLIEKFGGEEKFALIAEQISNWAKQNLQQEIYNALASNAQGVLALYNMMSSADPVLSHQVSQQEVLDEKTLKKMMQDPRYWRDQDNSYIARITKGFERLYPNNK